MFRTHTCGELNENHINQHVTLCGWIQSVRDKGFIIYIDLRDRYGITQLTLDENRSNKKLIKLARTFGREFVIQAQGVIIKRKSKNIKNPTGNIEILVSKLKILNSSETPPFRIEDQTDGREEIRMKFRYLDIRRNPIKNNLIFRSQIAQKIRNFLVEENFIEVETPILIKSTPEGARDFLVPSRMNTGEFYALPQSPQIFKQLLMIGGLDKYFQISKCFRDEDLRSDRQPEFTQIDCEMSFVEQEDILNIFERMIQKLLFETHQITPQQFPRLTYKEAIKKYGTDKPDIRFDMQFVELNELVQGKGFVIFDSSELVVGINIKNGCDYYTRKQLDQLTHFVKSQKVGANQLFYIKFNNNGILTSSIDKFYSQENLQKIAEKFQSQKRDLMLILAGKKNKIRSQLSILRIELAEKLNLRSSKEFAPLWIIDFPLLKFDKKTNNYTSIHHPFTAPKNEDIDIMKEHPLKVRANAYDLILNGNEIGGGSIRIYKKKVQLEIFNLIGFTKKEAEKKFGFLMNSFKYGAPPHAGIAFGFDRLVSILRGKEIIRDFIAFPKNKSGRDVMIETPSQIEQKQLNELNLFIKNSTT